MQTYKDLATEVEIIKIRINDLETEYKRLRKMMFASAPKGIKVTDYGKERVKSNYAPYPLDEIVVRLAEIENKLQILYDELEQKEETLQAIKEKINEMDGLQHKIAYMREVEGKTLSEIADELGYSYIWIRQQASKKHTKNIQKS